MNQISDYQSLTLVSVSTKRGTNVVKGRVDKNVFLGVVVDC